MEIFRLFGSILVDSSEAEKSIQKTGDSAKSLSSKIGAGLKTVGKAAAGIATVTAGAAAAAGSAIYSLSTDTAAVGDNIDKMSQKIGISREAYQELDFICSQSGTSVDNLKAGLKTLTSVMDTTKAGTSSTKTALEELGIAATDSSGNFRDNEEVMWEAFEALSQMEDQTAKERLAVELFGKAGSELMPMLNGSAEGIQAMREQAHELGLVMSDEAIDSSVAFTDTMDQLQRSFAAAKNNLGASLLPIIQKFAKKLLEYMPKIQSFMDKIIPVVERLAESIIDPIMEMIDELFPPLMDFVESLIEPVTDLISSILPVILDILKKLLPIITDIIKELLPPLLDILDDLMPIFDVVLELLDPILDLIKGLIKPIANILNAVEPFIDILVQMIQKCIEPLQEKLDTLAPFLEDVLGGALNIVSGLLSDVLLPAFEGILKFLSGDFMGGLESWGEGFTGLFSNIFSGIDSIFGTHLSEWYDEFNDFWMEVGSSLYEMSHQGDIEMEELSSKYTSLQNDLYQATLKAVRSGASVEDAMEQAKREVLDTSEKLYYFSRATDEYNSGGGWGFRYDAGLVGEWYSENKNSTFTPGSWIAAEEERKAKARSVPKLASGGIVYGDTLAMIGDNPDAHINPEVVAPLGDLAKMIGDAMNAAVDKLAGKMSGGRSQNLTIVVKLSDDTELTRTIIKNINECTRQDGKCVIAGI